MQTRWFQNIAAVIFLGCFVGLSQADTITMKDGTVRTGSVLEEKADSVRFRDTSVGEIQLSRAQIASVQKQSGDNSQVNLQSARAAKDRGSYTEAFDYYLEAIKSSRSPEVVNEFHLFYQKVYDESLQQMNGTPDKARQSLKSLYMVLTKPEAQTLFSTPGNHKNYTETASEVSSKFAEANVLLATRMANNVALRPQVLELLKEANTLTQNSNPAYLLSYGDAARNSGDLDSAFASYKAAVESRRATPEQLSSIYEGLNRVAIASNGRLKMNFGTPAPTAVATPVVVAMNPQVNTAPVVVPEPATPTGPPLPWWKSTLNSVKSGKFLNDFSALSKKYLSADILPILGVIIAAFFILWILPYQILKFLAKRGDSAAGERLFGAKRLGIISLLSYVFKRATEVRQAKHRCPFCNKGIDNMEDYKDLNFIVCPHCREPITPIYEMKDYVDHLITQLKISQKAGLKGQKGDVLIEKDAMLKLVRGVLAMAIRRRASDFHLETLNEGGKVRARVDGIMYDLITLPREISPAFISAIKVMAQLDITERRVPQDGKIALWIDQTDYDLRVNTSPASMGEKVVIRILRQDAINISPKKLGFDGKNLEVFERNINKPHGVIIVTGPSGSGKSTSLYVALNQLNSGDKNIVTIEDPIEYQLQGLSQMQVNPAADFTFANGLRSILRQDPDVIMVGEIRDKETAEAALDAAMTGHLVLTTLHTIDAPSAFSRMRDLGIEQVRVANAVNLVMAQRLVRTICPDCRKPYKPKEADLEKLNLTKDSEITFVHGTGCDGCMNTGYYGRLAIFEMLELNDTLRTLLETNVATTSLREAAKGNGLRTLREEGIRKVSEGLTTVEEVIRVTT